MTGINYVFYAVRTCS